MAAGTGQTALTRSPGDGFATDSNLIQKYNLSDPNAFFKTLLIRPYVNQVKYTAPTPFLTFAPDAFSCIILQFSAPPEA